MSHAHREPALKVVRDGKGELERLEAIISDGMGKWREMAAALAEIRENEHYKVSGFVTFDAYCRKQWGFSRQRAFQLTEGASLVSTIVDKQLPAPATEGVARELLRIKDDPKAQVKAWKRAIETAPDGKVTAKHVAAVVAEMLPKKEPPEPRRTPTTEPEGLAAAVLRLEAQRRDMSSYDAAREAIRRPGQTEGKRIIALVLDGGERAMALLGLGWGHTPDDLKKAWKRASLNHHPDRGGSHEKQSQINQAHALLEKWHDSETPL
jgi:hypothetical protein